MNLKGKLCALLTVLIAGTSLPAGAIEPIPETAGVRGFVIFGAGYTDVRSNLIAGSDLIDVGDPVITSVNQSPTSDDAVHPALTGEINYTFANRWQVFLGQSLEDAVTMDAVTQAGVRRDLGSTGIMQAGIMFNGVPAELWEDPYAENVRREKTDRKATGVRLQWDRVMGSGFELMVSYRDLSFDSELSGEGVTSVVCDVACRDLLRRDGDEYTFDVSYLYRLGENRNHLLRPRLRYIANDRDGDAAGGDTYRVQLTYAYVRQGFMLTSNLAVGATSKDARNPIYGRRTDSSRLAVDTTLFYRLPAASGRWQLVGHLLWAEEDSDVRFHDSELFMATVGLMYRFGAR